MADIMGLSAKAPYAVALLLILVAYFILYPVVVYLKDPKGKPVQLSDSHVMNENWTEHRP